MEQIVDFYEESNIPETTCLNYIPVEGMHCIKIRGSTYY